MSEFVSIITPVYKAEKYIIQTIESVLAQTYNNLELILVDDKSPDNSVEIICRYLDTFENFTSYDGEKRTVQGEEVQIDRWYSSDGSRRILLCQKSNNSGAASSRNIGLDIATSRYIAFIDADDLWLPRRLEVGMDYMEKKRVGFVYSAYEFGDEDANQTGKVVHVLPEMNLKQALSRTIIFTTTTLFDTEIVPKKLIHMPQIVSEDTATWWTILKAGYKAYGVDEVLAIYRRPSTSLSSNKIEAIRRIWILLRQIAELSIPVAAFYFCGWAFKATLRRV